MKAVASDAAPTPPVDAAQQIEELKKQIEELQKAIAAQSAPEPQPESAPEPQLEPVPVPAPEPVAVVEPVPSPVAAQPAVQADQVAEPDSAATQPAPQPVPVDPYSYAPVQPDMSAAAAAPAPAAPEFASAQSVPPVPPAAQQAYSPQTADSAYPYQAGPGYAPPAGQAYAQQPYAQQAYTQQAYVAQTYSHPKDHVAAGLLGVFLGVFGIHKFYLGYNTAGFIMLGVSLLGSLLTFGLAASVVWLIGLVEGIIYLVKSQPEFEQTYLAGKREWF